MNRALFIIDVQNDFTEGGALGVDGGHAVAEGISRYLAGHPGLYRSVFASRDWHSASGDNGGHFALDAPADFVNTWPVHCVEGTSSAEYDPALDLAAVTVHIRKGEGEPAYSIFEGHSEDGRRTGQILADEGITDVDVAGIATDFCVRASALDALEHGRHVRILTDLIAGVDRARSDEALVELARGGAELIESGSVA